MAPSGSKPRHGIFISYARLDGEAFANALRERLESPPHGLTVWQDRQREEGGRDWWLQITQALDSVEFMVLVMTPAACTSPTVKREWRYARQHGVCVYPVVASKDIDIASLPKWMQSIHWYDLEHQEQKFFNDLKTRCQVQRVPNMGGTPGEGTVYRKGRIAELKKSLLRGNGDPARSTTALVGPGGYGKTTIAQLLCEDDDIQSAFDDGVLWVTLGKEATTARLVSLISDLVETVTAERPSFEGMDAASTRLREVLADRDVLLVLDDVWQASGLQALLMASPSCARLITTHRLRLLPADTAEVKVGAMNPSESVELLAKVIGTGNHDELEQVAERLGYWPLLLGFAGAWLRTRIMEGGQPLALAVRALDTALSKRGFAAFDPDDDDAAGQAVAKTLDLALTGLSTDLQALLSQLVVFAEETRVPLHVVERLWSHTHGLDAFEVEEACRRLNDQSMIAGVELGDRFVHLHSTILLSLRGRLGADESRQQHEQLLRAYAAQDTPWHEVPEDGYYAQHLAAHLVGAGRCDELRTLLLSLDWIERRLGARKDATGATGRLDMYGLLEDYDRLGGLPELKLIRQALWASAHSVYADPGQLVLQIYGRLGASDDPALQGLCQDCLGRRSARDLLPLRPHLTAPGPLLCTLTGHRWMVDGVKLVHEGRQALSWSSDGSLFIWDLARGESVGELRFDGGPVAKVVTSSDSRIGLSWYGNVMAPGKSVVVSWDLLEGRLLRVLEGHTAPIVNAELLADGRRAISWSHDETLRLWDVVGGQTLRIFEGHGSPVDGAIVMPGPGHVLSWARNGSLVLWDLEHEQPAHVLQGVGSETVGALLLGETSQAISWSARGELIRWDLGNGRDVLRHRVEGDLVRGVVVLRDGQRVLTWSADGSIRVYGPNAALPISQLDGGGQIRELLVADDKRLAASITIEGQVVLWDLEQLRPLHRFEQRVGDCGGGMCAAASSGPILLWPFGNDALVYDRTKDQPVVVLRDHSDAVRGAMWLDGGTRAITWSFDGTLRQWDAIRGDVLGVYTGHGGTVCGALVTSGRSQVLSWSADATLKLWDLDQSETLVHADSHLAGVLTLEVLPDDRHAVTSAEDGSLKLWDTETGRLVRNYQGHGKRILGAEVVAGNPARLLSVGLDGSLKVWSVDDEGPVLDLPGNADSPAPICLLRDQARAIVGRTDGSLELWDLGHGALIKAFRSHGARVEQIQTDGEEALAVTTSADGTVKVWDTARGVVCHELQPNQGSRPGLMVAQTAPLALTWAGEFDDEPQDTAIKVWSTDSGTLMTALIGHSSRVNGLALLDDDRTTLSWGSDGSLRLWNTSSGQPLYSVIAAPAGAYLKVALSPDRTIAVSWAGDLVRVWDVHHGTLLHDLSGIARPFSDLNFHADQCLALTWSSNRLQLPVNGDIGVWDFQQGRCLRTLRGHRAPVMAVRVQSGGSRALSWSRDRTLRLWDLRDGRCLEVVEFDYPPLPFTTIELALGEQRAVIGDMRGNVHSIRLGPCAQS